MVHEAWTLEYQKYEENYRWIVGIPDLKIEEGKIGGDFQFGKKTKMYHYNMQHLTINCVLELLHMSYETYASWKS